MKSIVGFVLACVSACVCPTSTFAQSPAKFGEVTADEMKSSVQGADSLAEAVVLFDKGETFLAEDLSVTFTRHVRIKILSKEGFDWGDHAVHLSHSNQSIAKLKGNTYNLEGGTVIISKMEDQSIFKSKVSRYEDQVKFTLPNLKEGSIIEYTYQIRTGTGLISPWQFQYSIPSLYSEYSINIPDIFSFRKDVQGFVPISKHEVKGRKETFVMINVPAFKDEPFTSSQDDYLSKISFYISEVNIPGRPTRVLTKTWNEIVEAINEDPDFGGVINRSNFLKKTADEITAGMAEDEKKMAAVFDFVRSSVEWDEILDRYPDHTFKQVLEAKKGSSSEINLLLVSLLKKAGLNANPVFISTRNNGRVRMFLTQADQFNYVICVVKIKDKNILLDATDRDLPMTALPRRCLNGQGLVVAATGADWIDVTSSKSREVVSADMTINDDGELNGKITRTCFGIAGGDVRKAYKTKGEEKYVKEIFEGKNWEIEKSEFLNIQPIAESISETHHLLIHDHAQVNGPMEYLNPYILSRREENPLKSKERSYPVDFTTPFEETYMLKIQVPEAFVVEELPKPKAAVLPNNGGRFLYNISMTGNVINLTSMFTINKNMFSQEEYPILREFYDQVVAKQNEQIVLKKK